MAFTIATGTQRKVSIDEYVDHVGQNVDLTDLDSVAESASWLAALANDRTLVVRALNELVKNQFQDATLTSTQSLYLGHGPGFYVRANVWPSAADIASGRLYQDQFSYDIAHDHNYDFLTVPYHGPGYVTEIHEYDPDAIEGWPGEPVATRFLEKTLFAGDIAMLYRASRDVHIQYPPADLSITLNLMLSRSSAGPRDQYYFDLAAGRLAPFTNEQEASVRVSILAMAGHAGDENTVSLLTDLASRHTCRRTRLAAFEALAALQPSEAMNLWARACCDPEPLVKREAAQRLATRSER